MIYFQAMLDFAHLPETVNYFKAYKVHNKVYLNLLFDSCSIFINKLCAGSLGGRYDFYHNGHMSNQTAKSFLLHNCHDINTSHWCLSTDFSGR